MAQSRKTARSRKKSPAGLLSEAGKKSMRAIGDAARRVVGKKPKSKKSIGGNLSEAAKKAGRGIADAGRKAVGMKPTRTSKSRSR